MLGIRLSAEDERRLSRHANEVGRPKSMIARDWIRQGLDREDVDEAIRRASDLHARHATPEQRKAAADASDVFIRMLDAEDGGYDWGPDGPPPVR